jgi:hypothetical protein
VERDRVAAARWQAWPPDGLPVPSILNRWYATKIARESHVPADGVGYVMSFTVRREFLDRYPVAQVGGRDMPDYWIPAEDLGANIVGAIAEEAEYRAPVAKDEFARAAELLGRPLPEMWRTYLQGPSWFRRGWLPNQCYVWLYTPAEMLGLHDAWGESTRAHPGIAIIGGDGSREQLVLDLRHEPAPVMLVDITSAGWEGSVRQADDIGQLINGIESGDFEFS